jgi:hypothetical protein
MKRYEALEIDGQWFVFDRDHPAQEPYWAQDRQDAEAASRLWNILCGRIGWEKAP